MAENPWDPTFWDERAPGMWARPREQAWEKRSDAILNRPFISDKWDPRPELQSRIEDQRGLTLPQLDLQAKFLQSRGAYGLDPISPRIGAYYNSQLDPKYNVDTPLGTELGRGNIETAANEIARKRAGEILAMHVQEPVKKLVKKKDVK